MAVVACTPHPGLATVAIRDRPAIVRVVDLSTCSAHTRRIQPQATRGAVRVVASRHGDKGRQSIVANGKVVYSVRESYRTIPGGVPGPIVLEGAVDSGRWILFAIDPMNSQSLAADGLTLRAVSTRGGPPKTVTAGLLNEDYRTWCGGRLVAVAGFDRIANHNKWLITARPPDWRPHVLLKSPHLAFGSLACGADGRSVVVQSAAAGGVNMARVRPGWSLWRVGFDGSRAQLTSPPRGGSDESPQLVGSTIYFVRSGRLYASRGRALLGPLLQLPPTDGYYGHRAWPYTLTP
jgi:hypothetical protein